MVGMRSLLGYLVLDQPRQRITHWVEALAPLGAPGSPPPLQVDAYFVAAEDRALLGLWYQAGDAVAAALVAEVTRLAEICVIDPACLAEPDRRALLDRLAECEVIVDRRTSIGDALGELVRRARELRASPVMPSAASRTITGRRTLESAARDSASLLSAAAAAEWSDRPERGDRGDKVERAETVDYRHGSDPDINARAALEARGAAARDVRGSRPDRELPDLIALRDRRDDARRDDARRDDARRDDARRDDDAARPASRLGRPAGTRNDLSPLMAPPSPSTPLLPRARRASQAASPGTFGGAGLPSSAALTTLPQLTPRPARGSEAGGASSSVDGLSSAAATSTAPRASRERRARTEATTDPFLLAFEAAAPSFSVRYLRGARWLPAQLSQLSLEGAQLAAVSLPRAGDLVYLALGFGDCEVALRGEASHVSDEVEAQSGGAAFFQVRFLLDELVREQLYGLLLRARQAKAQMLPPPPRKSRRSAVVWPIMLATPRGSIRAELLDLSERGVFVAPLRELELEGNLGFSLVLDDQVTSVSGRAQVVRRVLAPEAKARGLRTGYGLELTDLAGSHRQPWERFVARVRRRAGRRVLIGAPSARFDELASGLVAVGYAVHGAVEPASVATLAEADRRPPDVAVLDVDWAAAGGEAAWIEALLAARGIRCVTSHGDPRRAYGEVDRLLGVGG